jgi:type II secretory pathway component PulM
MSGQFDRLQSAYAGLQPREQLFVRVGGVLLAVLVCVGLPIRLHGLAQKAAARVTAKQADLAYLQSVTPTLSAAPPPQDTVPLVNVVDATTREGGLSGNLKGTEPSGNESLRVRFEGASFEQLTNWFIRIGRDYGVSVQSATIDRADGPGLVNASIVLLRR